MKKISGYLQNLGILRTSNKFWWKKFKTFWEIFYKTSFVISHKLWKYFSYETINFPKKWKNLQYYKAMNNFTQITLNAMLHLTETFCFVWHFLFNLVNFKKLFEDFFQKLRGDFYWKFKFDTEIKSFQISLLQLFWIVLLSGEILPRKTNKPWKRHCHFKILFLLN